MRLTTTLMATQVVIRRRIRQQVSRHRRFDAVMRAWASGLLCCSLVGFLGQTASAQTPSRAGGAPGSLLNGLPGVKFEWAPVPGVTERGALLVPVEIAGANLKYQFDTGADATVLYGTDLASRLGWSQGRRSVKLPGIRVGETLLPATWAQVQGDRVPEAGQSAGTLGLDVLIGKVVIIDFPGKRLFVIPRADVPGALWNRIVWTDAEIRNGKFFVHLRVNGRQINDLFFDTGASMFPAIFDVARWESTTGRSEAGATQRVRVNSWGRKVNMLGAPITSAVEVDSLRYEKPLVFFQKEKDAPSNFMNWPFPVGGSIGNALFFDEVIAMDLGVFPQFWIVR